MRDCAVHAGSFMYYIVMVIGLTGGVAYRAHRDTCCRAFLLTSSFQLWNFGRGIPNPVVSSVCSILYVFSVICVSPYLVLIKDSSLTHNESGRGYAFWAGIVFVGLLKFMFALMMIDAPKFLQSVILSMAEAMVMVVAIPVAKRGFAGDGWKIM